MTQIADALTSTEVDSHLRFHCHHNNPQKVIKVKVSDSTSETYFTHNIYLEIFSESMIETKQEIS